MAFYKRALYSEHSNKKGIIPKTKYKQATEFIIMFMV